MGSIHLLVRLGLTFHDWPRGGFLQEFFYYHTLGFCRKMRGSHVVSLVSSSSQVEGNSWCYMGTLHGYSRGRCSRFTVGFWLLLMVSQFYCRENGALSFSLPLDFQHFFTFLSSWVIVCYRNGLLSRVCCRWKREGMFSQTPHLTCLAEKTMWCCHGAYPRVVAVETSFAGGVHVLQLKNRRNDIGGHQDMESQGLASAVNGNPLVWTTLGWV